ADDDVAERARIRAPSAGHRDLRRARAGVSDSRRTASVRDAAQQHRRLEWAGRAAERRRRFERTAAGESAAPDAAAAVSVRLQRGEALKMQGAFDDAAAFYRRSSDPAAREALALSLAHAGHDLDRAKQLMEETIALYPQIQEFQALALAYIQLKRGDRDDALRIYRDNFE